MHQMCGLSAIGSAQWPTPYSGSEQQTRPFLSFDKPHRTLEHMYSILPLGRYNLRAHQKGLESTCFQDKDMWY